VAPHVTEELRKARQGKVGKSRYTDETYLRLAGRWCYLYRAIDRAGNFVDVRFSKTRDRAAAEAFFASARAVTGSTPQRVTTDGHDAYPGAIKAELGERVTHRTSRYRNNHLEQDHRGIKGRYRPMRGFKSVKAPHGSAVLTTRCAISSAPRRREVGGSRPASGAGSISARSTGSSPSWSKQPDHTASATLKCS
jgi:transposase-like protein